MAKLTSREQDYSKWYNEIVVEADLAQHSDVKGCMVIKPYGFAIWERMKEVLDGKFKDTGHVNAYFPLLHPQELPEQGGRTRRGLRQGVRRGDALPPQNDPEGGGVVVDPEAKLEESSSCAPPPRPSSGRLQEVDSELPRPAALVNQWANVVRWEMRTRLFLRTTEFLWQEGHTAHATKDEAMEEAEKMLHVYADFAEGWMAMPVVRGVKSESERFAGADDTFCIEAMMQDGKGVASRHEPLPWTELRQGLRRDLCHQGRRKGIRLGFQLGRIDPTDGCPHHDAQRRQGALWSHLNSPPSRRSSFPSKKAARPARWSTPPASSSTAI